MKMKKILAMAVMGILALGFSSCENGDADFPDYEGGVNVYFAHQFLDRTEVHLTTSSNSRQKLVCMAMYSLHKPFMAMY